jgi:hypothetical protein
VGLWGLRVVVHACLALLCFLSHAYYLLSMIPIHFVTLLYLLCALTSCSSPSSAGCRHFMVATHFYARGALHEKLTTSFHDFMYQPNLRDYRALHDTGVLHVIIVDFNEANFASFKTLRHLVLCVFTT